MKTMELTNTDIMMRFKHESIEVNIYWNGGNYCSYSFAVNGIELSRGNDFRPSILHNIDDINTVVSLLGFISVKPGDTDDEYFKNHSKGHMVWLDSQQRDDIYSMICDFEYNKENYAPAFIYFTNNTELYPQIIHPMEARTSNRIKIK